MEEMIVGQQRVSFGGRDINGPAFIDTLQRAIYVMGLILRWMVRSESFLHVLALKQESLV